MKKTIIGLQIALTFIVTFWIYLLYAFLDSDFGFDGLLGLLFFQPIMAIIFSGLTIFICLIAGLPIRLSNKINYWWTTNFYISILGAVCGLTFLFIALLPDFNETVTTNFEGRETLKQIPNTTLSYIGWFLTAFSILHAYPPRKFTKRIKSYLSFLN